MGGDLGGLGGRPDPTFEVGDGPCIGFIRPPNILRTIVLSDASESTKRVKRGVMKELFCEILVNKVSYMIFDTVKMWKI